MTKDAFDKNIKVGDSILYSTKSGGGTIYHFGKIIKLHPFKNKHSPYSPPDRVEIKINKSSCMCSFVKNPIVYASNVVKIK